MSEKKEEKKSFLEEIKAALWFVTIGALFMAGIQAADWLIPDPPREPVKIKIEGVGK